MSIITRKIELKVVGDKKEYLRVLDYIRDGAKNQSEAMNQYMSALYYSEMMEATKDDRKELHKLYDRIPTNKHGSAYTLEREFAKGLGSTSYSVRKCEQSFKNAKKVGLMKGKQSLPTFKKNMPLYFSKINAQPRFITKETTGKNSGMYYEYDTYEEFDKALKIGNPDVKIQFANDIVFKVKTGSNRSAKNRSLMGELRCIFEESWKVCDSSIQIKDMMQYNEKKRKKELVKNCIILNLSVDVPDIADEGLNEDIVCGVDLGVAIPACCALNTSGKTNKFCGTAYKETDDNGKNIYESVLLKQRLKIQMQRKRLQSSLKYTSGGHGRKKKLQSLNKLKNRERNFISTMNHTIAKQIVDFASSNHAKYINIENLSGIKQDHKNEKLLRNWTYYELQQDIIYKAKLRGIEVRKINPAYTSQKCSCCGYVSKDNRTTQALFKCIECGISMNADFNAARNIAMSTDFMEKDFSENEVAKLEVDLFE